MSGRRRGGAAALVLALALASCAGRDEPEKARARARSWAGTIRMAGEAWARGSAPRGFARVTLDAAREQARQQTQALERSRHGRSDARLITDLRALDTLAAAAAQAIQRGDRGALAVALARDAALERGLTSPRRDPAAR